MLTIQPNFTQYSQQPKRVSFKSAEYNDSLYREKTEFYEHQAQEFENLIDDETTPKPIKKLMKAFKVVSEALLEGWAVAWGASKGARVIKSAVMSGANSKIAKDAHKVVKPMGERIAKIAKFVATTLSTNLEKLKTSNFADRISKGFSRIAEKLNTSKIGKKIVKGATIVGNGIKTLTDKALTKLSSFADSVKNLDAENIYDKTAKASSKVLGVGAGAAGGYNALTDAEERAEESRYNRYRPSYEPDEFDEFEELEYVKRNIEGED